MLGGSEGVAGASANVPMLIANIRFHIEGSYWPAGRIPKPFFVLFFFFFTDILLKSC